MFLAMDFQKPVENFVLVNTKNWVYLFSLKQFTKNEVFH